MSASDAARQARDVALIRANYAFGLEHGFSQTKPTWSAENIKVLLDEIDSFQAALLRLVEAWETSRAHTYASENAEHYRGFDAGQRRCAEAVRRLLASPPSHGAQG